MEYRGDYGSVIQRMSKTKTAQRFGRMFYRQILPKMVDSAASAVPGYKAVSNAYKFYKQYRSDIDPVIGKAMSSMSYSGL